MDSYGIRSEFFNRRYLAECDFRKLPHIFTDALVIGSGAAGLRAAIELSGACGVLLVTKRALDDSATKKAQGGVAIAVPSAGGVDGHVADTISAGDGLCDEDVVRFIVGESQARIDELVQWGAEFDKEDSQLALTREGGHSGARIVHAMGDATGKEIIRCLLAECRRRPNIRMMESDFVVDLVSNGDSCLGALILDAGGEFKLVRAGATVLASGGCGHVYRETTGPEVCTGDGLAMAYRAGARLCDMEFVQFHPTTLYVAGAARALISEVLRGEGGILIDKRGKRFMKDYHPDGELASRDVVCRAILAQMRKTNDTNVFLDVSHLPPDVISRRFPGIRDLCAGFDIDISKDPMPVRPSAHYMMGGVLTDIHGRTGIAGLYACGEVACTGFHGANRLGSNSLLESFVMGRNAGRTAAEEIKRGGSSSLNGIPAAAGARAKKNGLDVGDVRNSLTSLMSRNVEIERDGEELRLAMETLEFWGSYVMEKNFSDPGGWEIQNMLTVARLIVEAALMRCESRGAHHRIDFPERSDEWARHICLTR